MIVVTRILAYGAAVLGTTAYPTIITRYFEAGIWPMLIAFAVAGAAIGLRIMPVGRQLETLGDGGLDAVLAPRVRSVVVDLAVVVGISLVGGYLAVLALGGEWYLPLAMLLLIAMAIAIGLLAGMLVLAPLGMLVGVLGRALAGRPVAGSAIGIAALLLTVTAFGIVGVLAVGGDAAAWTARGRAATGILVVLTGVRIGDVAVASEPLAWTARGLAALLVVEVVFLVRTARARRRSTPAT